MPSLLEHNRGILQRAQNLQSLEPQLRALLVRGKTEHLLQGLDRYGMRFAPLAASTMRERSGTGPPLSPLYQSSAIIAGYTVDFSHSEGRIVCQAGWPMAWVKYHISGTRRMPKRDPSGFRAQDLDECRAMLRRWVMEGHT